MDHAAAAAATAWTSNANVICLRSGSCIMCGAAVIRVRGFIIIVTILRPLLRLYGSSRVSTGFG